MIATKALISLTIYHTFHPRTLVGCCYVSRFKITLIQGHRELPYALGCSLFTSEFEIHVLQVLKGIRSPRLSFISEKGIEETNILQ